MVANSQAPTLHVPTVHTEPDNTLRAVGRVKPGPKAKPIATVPQAAGFTEDDAHTLGRKFAGKVPYGEREDVYQSLRLKFLETPPQRFSHGWSIAANWVKDWWKAYSYRQHYSLDWEDGAHSEGGDDTVSTLSDSLASEIDCIAQIEGVLDGQGLWTRLPESIQTIVRRRLMGYKVIGRQAGILNRWVAEHASELHLAV